MGIVEIELNVIVNALEYYREMDISLDELIICDNLIKNITDYLSDK